MNDGGTRWGVVAVLLVAGLFSAAQFGKFTLTLTELGAVYGTYAGPIISVVGMVGIVFGAVAGGYVARFGLRRALIWALVIGGLLSLVQTFLPVLPAMIALRVVEGFSHLAIVIAAPTLMAQVASDTDRPVAMGIWASFFGVALAILAVLTPVLLSIGGLPAALAFHGSGMMAMAALVAFTVPQDPPSDMLAQPFLAEHKAIYSTPRAVIAGGGFGFYTILYIALIAVFPVALDLSARQTAVLPLVSLIGTFAAGFIARRVPPPAITLAGFGAMVLALGFCALNPGPMAAVCVFLSAGLIPGACFATIPYFNTSTADRARATGAIAQLGNVGTTTGTPIFVLAQNVGGLGLVLTVAATFAVVGMIVLSLLWRRIT